MDALLFRDLMMDDDTIFTFGHKHDSPDCEVATIRIKPERLMPNVGAVGQAFQEMIAKRFEAGIKNLASIGIDVENVEIGDSTTPNEIGRAVRFQVPVLDFPEHKMSSGITMHSLHSTEDEYRITIMLRGLHDESGVKLSDILAGAGDEFEKLKTIVEEGEAVLEAHRKEHLDFHLLGLPGR